MAKQILIVEASPRGAESASRIVSEKLANILSKQFPNAEFLHRDLTKEEVPHLDNDAVKAITARDPAEFQAHQAAVRLSDQLTEELLAADVLVIGTPTWNCSIPSVLKAWIDHVIRAGKTFNYNESGVVGHTRIKQAFLVVASGSVFSEEPWKSWDFAEPYLRKMLNFLQIADVQTVRIEGLGMPDLAGSAIPKAEKMLETLTFAEI